MKREVFERYVDAVCNSFRIDRQDLFFKSKAKEITDARQMLYYVCKIRPMSPSFIQRFMAENGYRTTHSTILYGISAMTKKVMEDIDYGRIADKIVEDDLA